MKIVIDQDSHLTNKTFFSKIIVISVQSRECWKFIYALSSTIVASFFPEVSSR